MEYYFGDLRVPEKDRKYENIGNTISWLKGALKKKNGKSEKNSKRNVFEIVSFATRRATRREEKSSSGASHMVGRRSEEKEREGPRWRDHAPNDLLATITPHYRKGFEA